MKTLTTQSEWISSKQDPLQASSQCIAFTRLSRAKTKKNAAYVYKLSLKQKKKIHVWTKEWILPPRILFHALKPERLKIVPQKEQK